MNPTLIIQDDALHDPVSVWEEVTKFGVFQSEVSPADGATYPNICKDYQPVAELTKTLSQMHGGKGIEIVLSCYRLGVAGEPDDTYCHADGIYNAKWAAVLYLNRNCQNVGGTAFFRHISGIDRVPDDGALQLAGYDPVSWHKWMTDETKFENSHHWALSGFAGLKFNRLITYPTACFHARSPNHITEPFGATPDTGRLVLVAFYNVHDFNFPQVDLNAVHEPNPVTASFLQDLQKAEVQIGKAIAAQKRKSKKSK